MILKNLGGAGKRIHFRRSRGALTAFQYQYYCGGRSRCVFAVGGRLRLFIIIAAAVLMVLVLLQ